MTRIFIENFEVDLTQDLSNELTFSVDDIRNLDSKTTSFTKTIILPGTQNNNKIFGNIFELGNANFSQTTGGVFYDFDVSKAAEARIEVNGLQAMKGVVRLMSINIDNGIEYEVAIFGELGGFMSAIGIKKLENLDFSEYNHQWNVANIKATFDSPANITTGDVNFQGPYSTELYPIIYRIRCTDRNYSFIQANSTIKLTTTTGNNGVYTVAQVFYFLNTNDTDIYVFEPFPNLTNDTGITIEITDPDGYGYVYPLIDYGVADPTGFPKDHDYRNFRPALFVLEYLHKIITGAGYTWESKFLNNSFFRSLIIPNNDQGLENRDLSYYVEGSTDVLNYVYSFTTSVQYNEIPFANTPTLNNFSYSSNKFTYTGASTINIRIILRLRGALIKKYGAYFRIIIKVNDSTEIAGQDIPGDPKQEYIDTINVDFSQAVTIKPGDYINIITAKKWNYFYTDDITFNVDSCFINIVQDPPGFVNYDYGDLLNINYGVPKNVYQKDFFISIMKLFNLMVVEKKDRNRHLVIEPYVDFFNTNISTYRDWSYKVNRDKPMVIKPMSEINARIYEFKMKEDSDYYNELYKKKFNQTYGNRIYDNQLEFAKDNQSVEIIFSPSILVGYDGEDKVFPAIYKYDENTFTKTPTAHNIRIMQIKRIDVDTFDIYNGATILDDSAKYLYAGHFNDPDFPYIDINFGATKQLFFELAAGALQYNAFNNFYSPYMAEIIDKDSRLLSCEMLMTERDIYDLDFSRFILIDGVLFRLMKINNWSENNICKVDLLRVINSTYLPDSPTSSKVFRMRYKDLSDVDSMLSGLRDNVDDWNTFFGLSGGNIFTACYVENKDILLIGNLSFNINANLFQNNTNIIALWDNIGCLTAIYDYAFNNSSIETCIADEAIKIGINAFRGSELSNVSLKKAHDIDEGCFDSCYNLRYINLDSLGQCGGDLTDNNIFQGISGKNINLTIPQALYALNDADIDNLIANNTVTLTLV